MKFELRVVEKGKMTNMHIFSSWKKSKEIPKTSVISIKANARQLLLPNASI